MGPSGCGKSTLLNLVGLIDRPSGGRVVIAGRDATRLDDDALTHLRRSHVGYVFQFFNLLPTLTLRENAALPLALAGTPVKAHREAAGALLAELGLTDQADRYPHQVSGGQMQRAAIARAIIHAPALVLADEPTGNLDSATGEAILELLGRIRRERNQTILMATHSPEAAAICDRVGRMRDGRIVADA
jgi:ABC-type lipoprotein export system ATPase subunit